jgi:PAS domain S-box-containing protein
MGWKRECAECATSLAIKTGDPARVEKYVEELGVWLDVRAYPILDEAGKVVRVIEHLRDISDVKRAEQALRESETRAAAVAERANDAIVIIKGDDYVYANSAWERLTGYTLEELQKMPLPTLLVPEERERVMGYYRARLEGESPPPMFETRVTAKSGEVVDIEISASTLPHEGVVAEMAVIRDISKRRKAEREQRELQEKMQQAQKLESLGVLAGGIAHDFNNLLVGILGNASLALADLPESSPVFDLLGDIESSAMRAAELVQQLLAYAGKGRVFTEPLDLGGVVRDMAQLLEASISKKTGLRLELTGKLPPVEADPNQIRQVVMNLVTNASEALEANGTITVTTGSMECDVECLKKTGVELPAGTYCFIQVTDTGRGLEPSLRSRIFEPFFTTKFAGRGLGLAAVVGIVRNHRGTIQVESKPGRGSSFTVLLPAAGPGVEAKPVAASEVWRGEGTVLLVDDEETVRVVGRRMLERLGFEVVIASDGRQALEIFDADPDRFVLVLLDLSMPVMNGTECLEQLRQRGRGAAVPVVLSSGYTEEEATSRFSRQGLAGFIQKPYRLQSLREKVQGILGDPPIR